MSTKPTTVLGTIEAKFVGYHTTKGRQYIGVIVVDNSTDFTVSFSMSLVRRGQRKGVKVYDRYQFSPHSRVQYYPVGDGAFLSKGDRFKVRSSKKGALQIQIIGVEL